MVCNGPTSGVDALRWAALMLAGRRARYALVVGVEPDDEVGRRLLGTPRLLDGAAAAVLERAGTARVRGATPRLRFGAFARESGVRACLASLGPAAGPATWYVPQTARELSEDLLPGVPRHDLSLRWGPASGALGVLQCAAAAAQLAGGAAAAYAIAGGDEDDASAGMLLLPGAVTRCGP
jgi:3-oxoacyl-[acyl-carrier-protein] synthase II